MSKKQLSHPALNIQWPWGTLVISGQKKVETRSYPLPEHYIDQELFIVETPGSVSKAKRLNGAPIKAEIIGIVVFGKPFKYLNRKQWENDKKLHLVEKNDPTYGFSDDREKWGWPIKSIEMFERKVAAPTKRGIRFTSRVTIQNVH